MGKPPNEVTKNICQKCKKYIKIVHVVVDTRECNKCDNGWNMGLDHHCREEIYAPKSKCRCNTCAQCDKIFAPNSLDHECENALICEECKKLMNPINLCEICFPNCKDEISSAIYSRDQKTWILYRNCIICNNLSYQFDEFYPKLANRAWAMKICIYCLDNVSEAKRKAFGNNLTINIAKRTTLEEKIKILKKYKLYSPHIQLVQIDSILAMFLT